MNQKGMLAAVGYGCIKPTANKRICILIIDLNGSRGRFQESKQLIDQGGLANSGSARNAQHIPAVYIKINLMA